MSEQEHESWRQGERDRSECESTVAVIATDADERAWIAFASASYQGWLVCGASCPLPHDPIGLAAGDADRLLAELRARRAEVPA